MEEIDGLFLFSFFFFNVYFIFEREREIGGWEEGKGQREGDRESKAASRLQAVSTEPDVGLKPTNHEIMT